MQIDWTISIGAILQTCVIAVGGIGVVFTMRADLASVSKRLDALEKEAEAQTAILIQLAEQKVRQEGFEVRLNGLERRLDTDERAWAKT
jgi:hypothetical protein